MNARPLRAAAAALAFVFLANALSAAAAIPASTIHPGDKLNVAVLGEDELTTNVVVRPDGGIDLPLAGTVRIAGSTPSAAAEQIATVLRRYLKHPQVTVALLEQGQIDVLVLGNVKEAGKFKLRSGARLADAIAVAGGLDVTNGTYPTARIAWADGSTRLVPLESLLRKGDETANVELGAGTAVYIPGFTQIEVTLLGALDTPGVIRINEGDRLSMAIAKAGNTIRARADLSRVMVTRTEADGKTASHEVDLYKAVESGDIRYDPRLKKGDVVYVPEARKVRTGPTVGGLLLRLLLL